MEIWDAYDKDGNKIGMDLIRGEDIPAGLYHMVCEVLVRHTDGDFLLMRRDPRKPSFPGLFEATAGGSAVKGEDADTCVRRELLEETGIRGEHFIPVDVIVSGNCIYCEYFCETDCAKDSIRLQEGETVEYQWVDKGTLVAMMEQGEVLLADVDDQRIPKFLDLLEQGGIVPVT